VFSAVIGAVGALNSVTNGTNITTDEINEMKAIAKSGTSIAARARQTFFTYPVVFSASMADPTLAMKIAKFLEIQYALFTTMSVGLEPKALNDDLGDYLKRFSGEDYDFNPEKDVNLTISSPNEVDLYRALEDFEKYAEKHHIYSEYEFYKGEEGTTINLPSKPAPAPPTPTVGMEQMKHCELKLTKAGPTIIELGMFVKDIAEKYNITIAIKVIPHMVLSDEFATLVNAAMEDKNLRQRFIKLTSGEISFFKDFLFNMDRSKRDAELYKRFGRHPWYQQFAARKTANLGMRIAKIASVLFKPLRAVVSGADNFPPTATLVSTVEELEAGARMKYGFFTSDPKHITKLMSSLMLLGVGVYDPANESIDFYFNGFKRPMRMYVADMNNGEKDATAEMAKVMQDMLRRGIV
jgi:hypothetical protein